MDFRTIARLTLKALAEPCTITQTGEPFEAPNGVVVTETEGLLQDGSPYRDVTLGIPEEDLQRAPRNGDLFAFAHIVYSVTSPVTPDHDGIYNIPAAYHATIV